MYIKGSIETYLNDLAAKKSAPGGGSAAALQAATGAALMSMVANYTAGNPKCKDGDAKAMSEMCRLLRKRGTLLLTVPYCGHYFDRQGTRVYDISRLQRLAIGKFTAEDKIVYLQDKNYH